MEDHGADLRRSLVVDAIDKSTRGQHSRQGHVSLTYNQAVGAMYSNLIQNNRVLDGDRFWIGSFN